MAIIAPNNFDPDSHHYKRHKNVDKNVGNFLVRSVLKLTSNPALSNARAHDTKLVFSLLTLARYRDLSNLLRSPIVSHVPKCNKLYIGETGRRLGDRFREHLCDVEKNDKDASKPVARHFNLPNHSKKHMAVCGLSLHLGKTESRKNLEQ